MHCLPSRHQLHIVVEAAFTSELEVLACCLLALACLQHLMHLLARNSPIARKYFTSELDPDRECDPYIFDPVTFEAIRQKFKSLPPCKNNCRGGILILLKGKNMKIMFNIV